MNKSEIVIILCTVPDKYIAQELATKVLSERLTACVTFLCGAISLFHWEGKLEQKYEVQMILKTDTAHQQKLIDYLKSHHPYQTPELLVLPLIYVDQDYLSWIKTSLR